MEKLPGEIEIARFDSNRIILSNLRVNASYIVFGGSQKAYLFLEDITYVRSIYKSHLIFLALALLGIICVIGAFNERGDDAAYMVLGGLSFAGLMLFLYYYTRKHFIRIASNGTDSINFSVDSLSEEIIDNFIFSIQLAKFNRISLLHKTEYTSIETDKATVSINGYSSMKCSKCNISVGPEDIFCENCGNKLK